MLVISSREFRQNQRKYFDKVDQGVQVVVQRGNDKSYMLSPITEDDVYFSAKMIARIKEGIRQVENGEGIEFSSRKEIQNLLGL